MTHVVTGRVWHYRRDVRVPQPGPGIGRALTVQQQLACALRILAPEWQENLSGHLTWANDDGSMWVNPWGVWWQEVRASQIIRVDADGNVRITADGNQALGDKAVYYVDKQVFVLVGNNLRLLSKQGTLTARDSLEYWEGRRLAVARGDATVVQQDQRIRADILTAHIADKQASGAGEKAKKAESKTPEAKGVPQGAGQITQVDAFGNVHISLQNAIVRGDTGVYTPANGVATICGNVRITSGNNQLNGKCAEVNLKTGIYRLTGRATGLVLPEKKDR